MAKAANPNDVYIRFTDAADWLEKNCHLLRTRSMKEKLTRYINVDWAMFHATDRKGGRPGWGQSDIYTFIGTYTGETTENIERGTPIVWRWKAAEGGGTNQYKVGNSKWMFFGEAWTKFGNEFMK